MGRALYDGWIASRGPAENIAIVDALPTRCIGDPDGGSSGSTMMVVAVKPQHVGTALQANLERMRIGDCVVSIAAGIELARIGEQVPAGVHAFRAMPNIAVSIGQGSIGLCHQKGAPSAVVEAVEVALSGLGECVLLDECLIEAFTALAGSGPAYFFAFTEQLAHAGQAAGLPAEISQRLAEQVFIGAAALLERSGQTPGQLREMVTSPGGTTEAGLAALNCDNAMALLVGACLTAAKTRGGELARAHPV